MHIFLEILMQSFYIIDTQGRVLINFDYRGKKDPTIPNKFMSYIQQNCTLYPNPVFCVDGWFFSYIFRNNLYFISVTSWNSNVALQMAFLTSFLKLLGSYFKEITATNIVRNYYHIYDLLDEVMDYGYPQVSDSSIIDQIIPRKNLIDYSYLKKFYGCCFETNFRRGTKKYSKNEIEINIVEQLNISINKNGSLIKNEIIGEVKVVPRLSDFPFISLGIDYPFAYDEEYETQDVPRNCLEIEEMKFHNCVKYSSFETFNSLYFIPPDDEFVLMTYKILSSLKPIINFETEIRKLTNSKVEFVLKANSYLNQNEVAKDVKISIPLTFEYKSIEYKPSVGQIDHLADENKLIWSISQIYGQKHFSLNVYFEMSTVKFKDENEPIKVDFHIPSRTPSGFKFRYLEVLNQPYKIFPSFSFLTKVGNYEINAF